MAYYTVAHLLQGGSLTGDVSKSPFHIPPEHMTADVWDFIFLGTEPAATCPIPREVLGKFRNEFLCVDGVFYFYFGGFF
jgi:leucyl-tRNA synthetase